MFAPPSHHPHLLIALLAVKLEKKCSLLLCNTPQWWLLSFLGNKYNLKLCDVDNEQMILSTSRHSFAENVVAIVFQKMQPLISAHCDRILANCAAI